MLIDRENLLSNAQAITADARSTDVIDLGALGDNLAAGEPINIRVQVVEDFNNLTSMNVALQTDDNSGFSSATTLQKTGEIAAAALMAGYVFDLLVMPNKTEQFISLYYDITGTAPSTGKITAFLTPGAAMSY